MAQSGIQGTRATGEAPFVPAAPSRDPVPNPTRPSLKSRLTLLFLVAVLPSIVIEFLLNYSDYQFDKLRLDDQIRAAAQSVGNRHRAIQATSERLLRLSAQAPELRDRNACKRLLRRLQDEFPLHANFSVVRPGSGETCSARPLDRDFRYDLSLVDRVLRGKGLASSDYRFDARTRSVSIDLGYPIRNASGTTGAAFITTLPMDWFYEQVRTLRLPEGTVAVLADAEGNILARHPDPAAWVGRNQADSTLVRAMLDVARAGGIHTQKVDGTESRLVSLPIPGFADEGLTYLGIAVPSSTLYDGATWGYGLDILALMLGGLLMLAATSWGSNRFVLRPIHALLGVVGLQKAGNPQARAEVGGVREFADLATELNAMFDLRSAAEHTLRESEKARAEAQRIGRTGNWSWHIARDEVVWAFGGKALTGPYPMEQALTRFIHPDDQQEFRIAISSAAKDSQPFQAEFRWQEEGLPERVVSISGEARMDDAGQVVALLGAVQDVTARRRAEEALRLTNRAIETSSNGILITDAQHPDNPVVYANPALLRTTGYSADEFLGRNCRFLQGKDTAQPGVEQLRLAMREGREAEVILRNYRKDGTLFWNQLRVSPVKNPRGVVTHFLGIQNDITELKAYEAELERQTNYDALTGLPSRNLLMDRITVALAEARRTSRLVAVLWLNIDRFQRINESMGRSAGDWILKTVGERLQRKVRESDTVARMGSDQFGIALPEIDSPDAAALVARKLTEAVVDPITVSGQEVFLTCSIGIAVYPHDAQWVSSLLANAEIAMTRSKGKASNFGFYAAAMNSLAATRLELETELRHAIDREELLLHYQPRISMASGGINGVEALIRWQHPKRGLVSPGEFIPLAEETGLIVPMGQWVIETACRQAREWREAGHADLRMAVNLSPRQFRQPLLAESVQRVLQRIGLPAGNLELEITESVAMDDPAQSRRIMQDLKAIGVSLAVDDFGTGHSSLGYLANFPVDYLKIDQSFVRGTPANADNAVIVRTVIALAHNLSLEVIAEGVETEEQRRFLQAEGCEEAQGFLFARPLPADQVVKLFDNRPALLELTG